MIIECKMSNLDTQNAEDCRMQWHLIQSLNATNCQALELLLLLLPKKIIHFYSLIEYAVIMMMRLCTKLLICIVSDGGYVWHFLVCNFVFSSHRTISIDFTHHLVDSCARTRKSAFFVQPIMCIRRTSPALSAKN